MLSVKVVRMRVGTDWRKNSQATSRVYTRPACVTSVRMLLMIVVCSSYVNRCEMLPLVMNSVRKTRKSSSTISSSSSRNRMRSL